MNAKFSLFPILFGILSLVLFLDTLSQARSQAQDASQTKARAAESQVRIEPFTFNTFDGKAYLAELGKLTVPEDRKSKSGRTIQVAFIRLMHRGENAGAPVVFLPPGPGIAGSVLGRVPVSFKLLDRLRDQGDVILIDIRGEGMSTPNLDDCPSPDTVSPHVFESSQSYLQQFAASVGNCAQFWRSRGVKLASYNNHEAAEDIEALRVALHYERLRLLGFSAGTDLGIAFLRQNGDVVAEEVFAATGAEELRPARPLVDDLELDEIALWYKAAQGAGAPDLGELFDQDAKALDAGNVILDLAEGKDGLKVQVKIGSVLLKSLVVEMLDGTDGALLPALLTSIHDRDYSLLQILAQKAFDSFRSSMTLIGRTVDCSFALPAEGVARAEAEARESRFGNVRNIYLQPSVCEAALGKTANAKPARVEPLFSRVPTLFISGTMDANTPPFDAETLRWGFPEAADVIVKNGFHETLTSPQVQDLVADFFLGRDVNGRSIVFDRTTFLSLEDARTAASHSH